MKCILLLLAVAVFSVSSMPSMEYQEDSDIEILPDESVEEEGGLVEEVVLQENWNPCDPHYTHDIFCQGHCRAKGQGYKSGYCKNNICHCTR